MKKVNLKASPVVFDKATHTYDLNGKELGGVTRIVGWLFPETYKDIPQDVLERAAERGTLIHSKCQLADTMGIVDGDEAQAYVDLMKSTGLTAIANEYTVSDEKELASQIDVVCEDGSLIDIKATSAIHIPRVTVQLSIYAYLFERQNPDYKVNNLYVVWLPRKQYGTPCIKLLERIPNDVVEFIISEFLVGNGYEAARAKYDAQGIDAGDGMPTSIQASYRELIEVHKQIEALKAREDEIKALWLESMQQTGCKKTANDFITITRKEASKRVTVDAKKLKSDYPDVYFECIKETTTNESLLIKIL